MKGVALKDAVAAPDAGSFAAKGNVAALDAGSLAGTGNSGLEAGDPAVPKDIAGFGGEKDAAGAGGWAAGTLVGAGASGLFSHHCG